MGEDRQTASSLLPTHISSVPFVAYIGIKTETSAYTVLITAAGTIIFLPWAHLNYTLYPNVSRK